MSRRFVATVTVALAAAIGLPAALSFALVEGPGGGGVLEGTIWVANEGSDRLTGIDADTHLVVAGAVLVGDSPAHVIVTPDGRRAFAAVAGSDSVAVIDVGSMRLEAELHAGAYPHGLRPSPDGSTVLVANMGADTVTLYDAETLRPLGDVRVGETPVQVAYAPDGRHAYVSVNAAGEVVKIDLEAMAVAGRAAVPAGPVQVAVTPDGATLLVASQGTTEAPGDTLAFVATASMTVTGLLTVGSGAHGVAIDPTGRQAFVTTTRAGELVVVDLERRVVADRIPVGGEPNGVSFSPLAQEHERQVEIFGRPLELELPLGGSEGGDGQGGGHQH